MANKILKEPKNVPRVISPLILVENFPGKLNIDEQPHHNYSLFGYSKSPNKLLVKNSLAISLQEVNFP